MAKIKVYNALLGLDLTDIFTSDAFGIDDKNKKRVIIADEFNNTITLSGSFTYDGEGVIKKGTVTSVTFSDSEGHTLVKYTGGDWALAAGALTEIPSVWQIATFFNGGNDIITGSAQGDSLFAGDNPGNDTILGLGGDDWIIASAGKNKYDGGAGFDQLTFEQAISNPEGVVGGVEIDVIRGIVLNPWGGKDTIKSIEAFRGTYLNDTMTGSKASEWFMGLAGH